MSANPSRRFWLHREHYDPRKMSGEAVEVRRVLRDEDRVEHGGGGEHDGINGEASIYFLELRERDARRLRDVDRGKHLGRAKQLLAGVRASAPPFRDDRQRDYDSCRAYVRQAQKADGAFLPSLRRDQRAGVEDVP